MMRGLVHTQQTDRRVMGLDILAVTASVSIRAEPRGASVKMAPSDDQHDARLERAPTRSQEIMVCL